jgi:hypothetical protein
VSALQTTATVDRRELTLLLWQARPDAFLGVLRAETVGLDLNEEDDRFLVWLASWDAETVAGVIRLLRLTRAASDADAEFLAERLQRLEDERDAVLDRLGEVHAVIDELAHVVL